MPSPLSISEQVRVLQSGADIATWSLQQLGLPHDWRDTNVPGNTQRCQKAVDQLFTLTREELKTELAAQGLQPEALPNHHTTPGSRDGFYFIPNGTRWRYYYQERGFPNFGAEFDDLAEAQKLLLNQFVPIWLERLRVPCRTADGRTIQVI